MLSHAVELAAYFSTSVKVRDGNCERSMVTVTIKEIFITYDKLLYASFYNA